MGMDKKKSKWELNKKLRKREKLPFYTAERIKGFLISFSYLKF